jgi:hypothetical protein
MSCESPAEKLTPLDLTERFLFHAFGSLGNLPMTVAEFLDDMREALTAPVPAQGTPPAPVYTFPDYDGSVFLLEPPAPASPQVGETLEQEALGAFKEFRLKNYCDIALDHWQIRITQLLVDFARTKLRAALDQVQAEMEAHCKIADMCFDAGASTDDGTSVGAVRGLLKLLAESDKRAREAEIQAMEEWGECKCDTYNLKHVCALHKHIAKLRALAAQPTPAPKEQENG